MNVFNQIPIKLYADGADKTSMLSLYKNPNIKGLTTNPTLMRKANIDDYESFANEILKTVKDKPISFEVFSDDFDEMYKQAIIIQGWQSNVFVKIPITNTKGESSIPLIKNLAEANVQLNITAILTLDQISQAAEVMNPKIPSILSLFAGRIADTGRDPVPMAREAVNFTKNLPKIEILWASVREILNIKHAADSGCHIVTVPHAIMEKALKMWGMDLAELSLDTVKMFHDDAKAAGYSILTKESKSSV
jgi:transaldolase